MFWVFPLGYFFKSETTKLIGILSKRRRRRQRGHEKTKDLIGRTIAQSVRFKTLYISFHLELNASLIRYAEVEGWRRMRR